VAGLLEEHAVVRNIAAHSRAEERKRRGRGRGGSLDFRMGRH
jgi:hypothetical protein